jgi:hypothetical protein
LIGLQQNNNNDNIIPLGLPSSYFVRVSPVFFFMKHTNFTMNRVVCFRIDIFTTYRISDLVAVVVVVVVL